MKKQSLSFALIVSLVSGVAMSNIYAESQSNEQESKNSTESADSTDSASGAGILLEKSKVTAQALMSELPIELQSKQVSIINKDTLLETSGSGGIQGVLEKVPGILYSRSGGINGQITIRG